MPHHEEKLCARCRQPFECKVGDIAHCHCTEITLSDAERNFIENRYSDCLCRNCLWALKNKYVLFKEKYNLP
ncbi:cysteine-rich CWC family protein [Hydrotalea sp.]|uniref:cysteine-rich CWC family protein n=1 Tax=Hydrotalea sp. TaxID=2881279 RepID=UPI00260E03B9|nr:cysteine-rich CWC family protein [Hydrotalea sp.]